jgi:uncharacterized protein YndB with AHSA1/START domain
MSDLEYVYMTVIAASPKMVWEGLTTAEFTKQYWHSTRVKSEWTVGSKIEFYVDGPDGEVVGCEGKILIADHPKELSYTWRFPRNPIVKDEAPSRVTFTLVEKGGNTILTVTHDEFPEGSKMVESISQGWPLVLAGLKTLLETGKAVDFSVYEE